jgi:hypothetical protein
MNTTDSVSSVAATLAQRQNVHGDFSDNSLATQRCMDALMLCPSWHEMSPSAKTATFLIIQKLSRAASGNPWHSDHWHDIQGYAKLVEDRLSPPQTPQ